MKPVHLGSSIGISKAKNRQELIQGIEVALFYDDKILVETAVDPLIEVTLPMIGNTEVTFGGIEQPKLESDFLDFSDKYIAGDKSSAMNSSSLIPAPIEPELAELVHQYGKTTYHTLGCSGIARVDFLINPRAGVVYVNEVNTMPGTLYVHNFKHTGMTAVALVSRLITLAEERHQAVNSIQHTFTSSILSNLGGGKKQ